MSDLHKFDTTNTENRPILILTTLPADANDDWLRSLLTEKLAGCFTKLPGATSNYIWQGKLVTDSESVYLIKSTSGRLREITAAITKNHPYEIPEIAVLKISGMTEPYWRWLSDSTSTTDKTN